MNALDYNPTIDASTSDADAQLIPPRFWWLKRIAVAIAAVLIVFTILFFWVEYRSRALLESRIAEWKAAGQPVDPQDFNRKSRLPDERNAAKLYNDAAASFTWPADIHPSITIGDLRNLKDKHVDAARKVVEANRVMLSLMQNAGELEGADWGTFVTSPLILAAGSNLSDLRECIWMTNLAADVAARDGQCVESIQHLRNLEQMAAHLRRESVSFSEGLVSLSATRYTTISLEHALPLFDIALMTDADIGILKVEMRALVKALLDERDFTGAWQRGIFLARASCIDAARTLADGTLTWASMSGQQAGIQAVAPVRSAWRIIARPLWRQDGIRNAEQMTPCALADLASPYHQVQSIQTKAKPTGYSRFSSISPISTYLRGDFTHLLSTWYLNIAQRRMAACAIAIRLYEWDHGHRPERLDELIPDYLTAIPIDPFDPDAGPIRYLPDAMPARLYSVGLNGIDEDGDYDLRPKGGFKWREKDTVFRLDPESDDSDPDDE